MCAVQLAEEGFPKELQSAAPGQLLDFHESSLLSELDLVAPGRERLVDEAQRPTALLLDEHLAKLFQAVLRLVAGVRDELVFDRSTLRARPIDTCTCVHELFRTLLGLELVRDRLDDPDVEVHLADEGIDVLQSVQLRAGDEGKQGCPLNLPVFRAGDKSLRVHDSVHR